MRALELFPGWAWRCECFGAESAIIDIQYLKRVLDNEQGVSSYQKVRFISTEAVTFINPGLKLSNRDHVSRVLSPSKFR